MKIRLQTVISILIVVSSTNLTETEHIKRFIEKITVDDRIVVVEIIPQGPGLAGRMGWELAADGAARETARRISESIQDPGGADPFENPNQLPTFLFHDDCADDAKSVNTYSISPIEPSEWELDRNGGPGIYWKPHGTFYALADEEHDKYIQGDNKIVMTHLNIVRTRLDSLKELMDKGISVFRGRPVFCE